MQGIPSRVTRSTLYRITPQLSRGLRNDLPPFPPTPADSSDFHPMNIIRNPQDIIGPYITWRPRGLSKWVISRVISTLHGVPLIVTLLIADLLSPLGLQVTPKAKSPLVIRVPLSLYWL